MTTGERIRELRKEHGMMQWELAEKVGCSKQVISNIERGNTEVSAEMAAKCADVFHVMVDNLTRCEDPHVLRLTADELNLIKMYRRLDPKGREFLKSMFASYQQSR